MAKPILLIRIPKGTNIIFEDKFEDYYQSRFPDYNVIVTDVMELEVSIITEHNQPQGLAT